MRWGWFMLADTVAVGASASSSGSNRAHYIWIRALVAGGAGGMTRLRISHLGGMTIGTAQTANRRRNLMVRCRLMLLDAMAGRAGARGLGGDSCYHINIGAGMTRFTRCMIRFGVCHLHGMTIGTGQTSNGSGDAMGGWRVVFCRTVTD